MNYDLTVGWHWPQWTWLILAVLTLVGYATKHGQPRENYNAFMGLINFGTAMFILICGGFFS